MTDPARIHKIDASRLQLVTAIRLLLENRDHVSAYQLACNAWEVLGELCKLRGIVSMNQHVMREQNLDFSTLKKKINEPVRNFCKHLDRPKEEYLEGFEDKDCDGVTFMASHDLLALEGKSPVEVQVFMTWFGAIYPDKVAQGSDLQIAANKFFPGLHELPRQLQKRAAIARLGMAYANSALLEHPETDIREFNNWAPWFATHPLDRHAGV